MNPNDLPYNIKKYLVEISQQLPNGSDRRCFCNNAGRRICEFAKEFVVNNKYTLFYSAVGVILGCVIKEGIKRIFLVGWALGPIADSLPVVLGLCGATKGFLDDCNNAALKRRILRIIQEELERAGA